MSAHVERIHPNHAFIVMVEPVIQPFCATKNEVTLIRNKLLKAGLGHLDEKDLREALQERLFRVEDYCNIKISDSENFGKKRSQVLIQAFKLTLPE